MQYTGNYNLKKPEGTDVINNDDLNDNADIIDSELKKLNTNKVDKVTGKGLSTEDYTTEEKQKLAGIEPGANRYTHPSTHPASMITESTSRRFVSDAEKSKWNTVDNKVDKVAGKGLSTNDFTNTLKSKLDGIEAGAQKNKVNSVNGKTGTVTLTKSDVGLSNVDNAKQATKAEFDAQLKGDKVILGAGASDADSSDGYSVVIGKNAKNLWGGFIWDAHCVSVGYNAETIGALGVAIGPNAKSGRQGVAVGSKANTAGDETNEATWSIAVGDRAVAQGYSAVSLGSNANAIGEESLSLGTYTEARDENSVAIGQRAIASNSNEGVLGNSNGKWKVPGSFTVNGTKNFEIPHPKPEKRATHRIRHGAVESPTAGDTLYRWKIKATKENDIQLIDLPDYFIYLNKNVQIFVTPQGHFGNGYGELNRETEQLEIHCQHEGEYNVLVIGTRNDDHPSVQDWDIKGVEREIGESWTGETYVFEVDEIMEIEEIKEVI